MTCAARVVFLAAALACGCGSPGAAPRHWTHPPASANLPAPPASIADWARGAKPIDGLGTFHRPITTSSTDAQHYFDQGMRLLWAFNHDEATRSFAKAASIDPACAMCDWGVALAVGPNYNVPVMSEIRATVAWEALALARRHASTGTPVERALIAALDQRYRGPQPLDPSNSAPVLVAYANAMRDVAHRFPDDLDVQVLFAEALMNTNPWKLWSVDGQPAAGTTDIETTLEPVLAKDPWHPGANHYYVHTMKATPPVDYYVMYLAHNYQFLAYSAAMEGRSAEALDAARNARAIVPADMLAMSPGTDWYVSEIYSTMIRFGMWNRILAEPAPEGRFRALTGGFQYAHVLAYAALGKVDEAMGSLRALDRLASALPPDAAAGQNSAKDVFAVAILVAQGEIALASGHEDDGVAQLRKAVAKEDRLAYDEPADWFLPVRHQLGAALMRIGQPKEAEAVYREDLVRHPRNGWALFGLAQALRAEQKDAAAVDREFADAWKHADVKLAGSVF